ncbi:MAG: calcium-binding protein [Gemmatimonadaceae bacterium]|nr:calcium-binding protein [Gemmatimonadaceae bacterium]MBA3753407.1 calcium-binding protein [Nitrospira sp.]
MWQRRNQQNRLLTPFSSRKPIAFAVLLERLERRVFMDSSSFAQVTPTGTLLVNGTAAANVIAVSRSRTQVTVSMDGASVQFNRNSVKRLYVDGWAGDDLLTNNADLRSTILGNDGNDALRGGPLEDSLQGGNGNDTLDGSEGSDALLGGDGTDTAEYGSRNGPFEFKFGWFYRAREMMLPGVLHALRDHEHDVSDDFIEVIGGTEFDDLFTSDWNSNETVTFLARGGNDRFDKTLDIQRIVADGGRGDDQFGSHYGGGQRSPTLIGGAGNDIFDLNYEPGLISGGPGIDSVQPIYSAVVTVVDMNRYSSVENASGNLQTVIGTDGPNLILQTAERFQPGVPRLIGNGGNDIIVGGPGAEAIDGGSGDDLLQGGGGPDTLRGGDGDDIVAGNSGNDKLYGGLGKDTLVGGAGKDRMYGDAGDDLLIARDRKRDTLYGGDGRDQATVDDRPDVKDLWGEIESLLA